MLGAVEDAEIGLEPHLERVLAENPVAERVKRRDLDVGVAVLHERVDALLHLGRGLVCEGEREDLLGRALRWAMSQAIRRVMTVVLPVPAPATIRRGPASWVTTAL